MTESEAKERLIVHQEWGHREPTKEALNMAISALEEVQQLHAIGTVSEFRELKEKATAKKPIDKFEFSPCPRCGSRETLGDGFCYVCGTILD